MERGRGLGCGTVAMKHGAKAERNRASITNGAMNPTSTVNKIEVLFAHDAEDFFLLTGVQSFALVKDK